MAIISSCKNEQAPTDPAIGSTTGDSNTSATTSGSGATPPSALLSQSVLATGDTKCPYGGAKLEMALIRTSMGFLILMRSTTEYVCNGAPGDAAGTILVKTTTETAGTNCVFGGNRFDIGIDSN